MNDAQLNLEALNACKDAADSFAAGMLRNLELQKEHTTVIMPEYQERLRKWNESFAQHLSKNEVALQNKKRELESERGYTNKVYAFGGCTFFNGPNACREKFGDWVYDGWCGSDSQGTHVRCRRAAGAVQSDLDSWKSAHIFPYGIPKPTEPLPPTYVPLESVTCCPNVVQISGSEISQTSINQANQCSTTLTQIIESLQEPPAPTSVPTPTPAPAPAPAPAPTLAPAPSPAPTPAPIPLPVVEPWMWAAIVAFIIVVIAMIVIGRGARGQ
jgi:hypothetical protein